jgi:hypothetical protein
MKWRVVGRYSLRAEGGCVDGDVFEVPAGVGRHAAAGSGPDADDAEVMVGIHGGFAAGGYGP